MNSPASEFVRELVRSGQISVAELSDLSITAPRTRRSHIEHFDRALEECPGASRSTYKTNFRRLSERFGEKPLDLVTTNELKDLGKAVFALSIRNGGIGIGAQSSFVHSARFYYRIAIADGVLRDNPAQGLELPRRRRRVRRALTEAELTAVYETVLDTSRDPTLDMLLLDFHRETGARRGGAVALRISDVNPARPSVLLREKGGHEREIPASLNLIRRMLATAERRGAKTPNDAVFRYRNGDALTRRRYNTVFGHVQRELEWARRLHVSIHWFRHTTLSDVAAASGIRVAAAFAGHEDRTVTDVYTTPTFEDLLRGHRMIFHVD